MGAFLVSILIEKFRLSPYSLMLIAAGVLLVCLALILAVNAREVRSGPPEAAKRSKQPLGKDGGFQLILRDKYLFWIAVTANAREKRNQPPPHSMEIRGGRFAALKMRGSCAEEFDCGCRRRP